MAQTKTNPTRVTVESFIDAVEPEQRRADAKLLSAAMQRLSGHEPRMWGPSIIGFGSYHYKYASGHEGDSARIGFSPRKAALVLYLADGFPSHQELLDRLGKYTTGKSCLYIKKLSDVDQAVLEDLISASLTYMDEQYPA